MGSRAPIVAAVLVAAVASLSGCVTEGRPETCGDESVRLEVTVTANGLDGDPLAACRGQDVTIELTSQVDGVVHVHGYDHAVPATAVATDEELELAFTADRSGQFPIELHPADDPEGVPIGILTVHER